MKNLISSQFPNSMKYYNPNSKIMAVLKIPWVVSDIFPHSKHYSGSDQAVLNNKWIKVRPREFENISHDGSASASKVIG